MPDDCCVMVWCVMAGCAEFHAAALQEAVYPDYALLYLRSAEWQSLSHAEVPPLAWEKYDVAQILVRHDQVHAPLPERSSRCQ